jgi:hypothetical protein
MRKELRPVHEEIACEVCGRTILKGERTEPFIAPSGERHTVCQLCTDRAQQAGWIRESAHLDAPATRRSEPRRPLFGRFRRRREREPVELPEETFDERAFEAEYELAEQDPQAYEAFAPPPPRRKDPRHVRAVPTNAQVKVERALELFNQSEHVRTIAGITRTLGEPWVTAAPATDAPSEVSLIVAWELSWYRYRVDLADSDEPVTLTSKGQELSELDDWMRDWNASALPDGRLAIGVPS